MSKLIVTKLNESVNNNNLRIFGAVKVQFNTANSTIPHIIIRSTGSYTVKAVNGTFDVIQNQSSATPTYIAQNQTEYTGSSGTVMFAPHVDNTIIEIVGKTLFTEISYNNKYATNNTPQVIINTEDLNYSTIKSIWNNYNGGYNRFTAGTLNLGTITDIANSANINIQPVSASTALRVVVPNTIEFGSSLGSFQVSSTDYTNVDRKFVQMDLSSFYHATNCRKIETHFSSLVTGSVNDLFDALHTNGKTSNDITVYLKGTNCTFNNQVLTYEYCTNNNIWGIKATFTASGWMHEFI